MIAMSAVIICTFIFPANVLPLIVMAYILSDIFNSYQSLSNKTPESINFIFMFLYGTSFIMRIITLPIFGYFILGVFILAILYLLTSYIKNSHTKNVLRATFNIIAIILSIFNINNSNLRHMNSIISGFSGFCNKFLPIFQKIAPEIFNILFPIWNFSYVPFIKQKLSNSPVPPNQYIFQTIFYKDYIYLTLNWLRFYYENKKNNKFDKKTNFFIPKPSLIFLYFFYFKNQNTINIFFIKILNTILNKLPKI